MVRSLAIAALGAGGLVVASALAADEPPLQFRPDNQVDVSWDKLTSADGARVEIVNNTARRQQLQFSISRFRGKNDRPLCKQAGCVTASLAGGAAAAATTTAGTTTGPTTTTPTPRDTPAEQEAAKPAVAPGGTGVVVLRARRGEPTPEDGSYSATLAAFDTQTGAFARVPLTVQVGKDKVAATPLASSVKTTIHCRMLLHRRCAHGNKVWIPLKGDVDPGAGGKNFALAEGPLGGVSGDHGAGAVRSTHETKLDDGERFVAVIIDGLHNPGDYEGKVDLTPGDDKTGDVTIKATVSDSIGWFIAAILTGIGLALLILHFTVGNKLLDAKRRLEDALHVIWTAKRDFNGGGHDWSGYDLSKFPDEDAKKVSDRIAELTRTRLTDLPADEAKALDESITTLAKGADDLDQFDKELGELATALTTIKTRPDPLPRHAIPPTAEPPVSVKAKHLHHGDIATLAALKARRDAVTTRKALVERWHDYEVAISDGQRRVNDAKKRTDLDDEQKEALRVLDNELLPDAWALLWNADEKNELDRAGLDDKLGDIEEKLAVVDRSAAPTPELAPADVGAEGGGPVGVEVFSVRRDGLVGAIGALLSGLLFRARARDGGADAQPPAPDPHAEVAKRLKRKLFWRQAEVTTLATILALVTALNALYLGKAWGTRWDYLNAVVWAFTTKTALDLLLLPAIEQLARLRPLANLFGR